MTAPATTATTRSLLTRGVSLERTSGERRLPLGRQLILQLILLLITFTVLFPLVWIVSMALDPRNLGATRRAQPDPAWRVSRCVRQGHRAADEQPDQLHRPRPQQHEDRDRQRGHRGRDRDPRRLRVLAAQVPRPGGADDRRPRRADAAGRRDDHPAVHLPQPVPDRRRRPVVQPPELARRRHAGRHLRPAAVRDLEPQGLSRHDPAGPRGSGRRRRRVAEPDLPQDHPAAVRSRRSRSPGSSASSAAGPST